MEERQNKIDTDEKTYKKPPRHIQFILIFYGFFWLNMIFVTGLNSLYIGHIDIDSGSTTLALTIGMYFIFKYLPRFY